MYFGRIVQVVEPPDFPAFRLTSLHPFRDEHLPHRVKRPQYRYFHLCTLAPISTMFAGNVKEEMKNILQKRTPCADDTFLPARITSRIFTFVQVMRDVFQKI